MRAAYYEAKGAAREVLKVSRLPRPAVSEAEVLVRVHSSGVNPSDTKRRGFWAGRQMPFPRIIPHQDGSGVIEAVGTGVPGTRIGERVWVYEAQWQRPFGTAAEFVVVPSRNAVQLPRTTSFNQGACLGIPAITAHYCLFDNGPITGKTVLIAGGCGAVGFYAIQLAKLAGATVLTTVSSRGQAEMAREAGADFALNRRTDNVPEAVRHVTQGWGVDRIVEVAFGANLALDIEIIRPGGVIAAYASDEVPTPTVPFAALLAKDVRVHFALVYLASRPAHERAIADISALLASERLRHSVKKVLPLEAIAEAHEAVETGGVSGKVVLEILPEHTA